MNQRQHTVPQTYLRGFADPKGKLHAFDRVRQDIITMSVGNATVVKNIYNLPSSVDGFDPRSIENFLAEQESAVAGALSVIRSGKSGVEPVYHDSLTQFIALQMTRTIRIWDTVQELGDWYGKMWIKGITWQDVEDRYRKVGIAPTNEQIERVLEFANNLDNYRIVPPDGSFLLMFLGGYLKILPYLADGWNWVVVRSSKPFLTSDHPVTMIGDSVDGGLGVANALEIWLPVGRHHAIVLTRDRSLPAVILDIPAAHTKRVCHRIAHESTRWVFWHPKDEPLRGFDPPPPSQRLLIEAMGWRNRGDGTMAELVRTGPNRPVIPSECLLGGREVVNYQGMVAPPWTPYDRHRPMGHAAYS